MLKFVKHHMETIIGIEIFPVISFLIFFIFFVSLSFYVFSLRKPYIAEVESLPMDDSNASTNSLKNHNQ